MLQPQRYVSQRGTLPGRQVGPALAKMLEEVWKHLNAQPSVTVGPAIVRYHGESAGGTVQIEAGFPIGDEPVPQTERIAVAHLPAGAAATLLHWGPYEGINDGWQRLSEWVAAAGHVPDGPRWEIYWVDPTQAADDSELRTELVWPVTVAHGEDKE